MSDEALSSLLEEANRVRNEVVTANAREVPIKIALSYLLGIPVDELDRAVDIIGNAIEHRVKYPADKQEIFLTILISGLEMGIASQRLTAFKADEEAEG